MLTVSLLICAMMALTRANGDEDTSINSTVVKNTNISVFNQAGCLAGWTPVNGRCIKYVTSKLSWAKAEANCQSMNGNLASIRNHGDYNGIQQITQDTAWVGASDCQETNSWFWSDGTPLGYTFWCAAQPDAILSQCCVQMNFGESKCWDDQPCSDQRPSICVQKAIDS